MSVRHSEDVVRELSWPVSLRVLYASAHVPVGPIRDGQTISELGLTMNRTTPV
jgi:hypothetical protein